MSRAGAAAGLEEELTCPICLGIYSTPVSLGCGHSFCRGCIREAGSRQPFPRGPFSCPLCGFLFDPAMEPQPNVQLRSIVEKFVDQEVKEEEESLGQQDKVILCDFCLQEPQAAVKTCLSCEASLCQAHLSKHSSKSPLKDHVLMEPCGAQVLAERRCLQHGKVLECYCKTDAVCLCVLCCVTSSHKNHEIATLEEAFAQGQSALAGILETVKTEEAALDQSIANLLEQEGEVKSKESLRRDRLESLFRKMRLQLDNRRRKVLKVLSDNEEQQLSQIQMQIQKYKEKKDAASQDVQKLEALRDQKDRLLFTKAFAALSDRKCTSVPKEAHVQLLAPPVILNELTTDAVLRLFRQFLSDMQSLFEAPPVHEHLTLEVWELGFPQSCKVVSAPPPSSSQSQKLLFGSSDTIFYGSSGFAFEPDIFQSESPALESTYATECRESAQSFSEGCHFWEVDTSNSRCWKLGIICGNFQCCLKKSYDYLLVFLGQTEITKKNSPITLTVVRVELDCRRNTLSFYNASVKDADPDKSLRLIETISIPLNYPVRAIFGTSDGSLELL
ncbi:E3 ubiquitin-protein ligase TRIM50-like [Rissa tridactyla]|uniref:E3 ubiquitin-protein ligase TRIM50-like n=1 Tax=Rissa tridactyla TaxID=75485 RepID=UPI0023BAB9DB|nr:E3 ubiquitin-protein ligase TRIM50-like [Rissa tridactyla]